jgi:hypothetical protein
MSMGILVNAIAGLLFGLGLLISGMADPAKVQNFLDVFGTWDPSLAFVMAGAVAVTFVGYRAAFRQPAPLLTERFHLPTAAAIDRRVVWGAAVFGIGWGLTGFCPGPAIVSIPLLARHHCLGPAMPPAWPRPRVVARKPRPTTVAGASEERSAWGPAPRSRRRRRAGRRCL